MTENSNDRSNKFSIIERQVAELFDLESRADFHELEKHNLGKKVFQ